ncbi:AraC family transcriptional regulator [Amycolatopsis antarctica]|uniref:AraC family transcriptional regulator n=1 Tax=Amycolatopsis antarctica TaxID=1854586 RepID=A0A263CXG7_9PSEU|nr:helix-turn-helix domain-containing protein [Amycolatopsis antarctica]OZM70843.1 AraC family transcriptional regulator [Amycolatopsis antarctica]
MSQSGPGRPPHLVAVLVRHGVLPMELGLVHQLFGGAVSAGGSPLYEVVTCAPEAGAIRTDADFTVTVEHGPEALDRAGTVVVPASHEDDERRRDNGLEEPLASAFARIPPAARVASICTGAFVLAAAGLLTGARATTHWKSARRFRELYPRVELDADVLYTDGGRILTSAGEASGIDLCLHLIRRDHGAAVANAVARRTVVPPHRDGGQAQFIDRPVPRPQTSSTGAARAWALANLHRTVSLGELAALESMSRRTFTRRFREETGTSPGQWLARQRIEHARRLLEESGLPVERVAADAGFGSAASLRQHFHAALGVSPTAYRRTFRGPE